MLDMEASPSESVASTESTYSADAYKRRNKEKLGHRDYMIEISLKPSLFRSHHQNPAEIFTRYITQIYEGTVSR